MSKTKIPKVPNAVHDKFTKTIATLKSFCDNNLNDEYYELSVKLAAKIARKRPSPMLGGRTNTWAAGIIHALGMVNFLFDKSQKPHMTSNQIAVWFDVVEFACLNQRSDHGPVLCACVVTGEEGVFAVQRDRADGAFDSVAVDLDAAVGQELVQADPVFSDVFQSFTERGFA